MAYVQEPYYYSISTPLGADKLLLRAFHGEERVSGLFRISMEMQSEESSLDFTQIVGKGATITVDLEDGSQRYFHGIVGRFAQGGADGRFTTYRAELFPWLWLLTFTADCRIFQEKTVPQIIEQVFSDLGQTDFDNRLTGTYAARTYCVQYNESAFAFVSRLMEEEGIFYFFEHADGVHTLVLADDPSAWPAVPGGGSLKYGYYGRWIQQNLLTACTLEQNVIPGSYELDDFNFETPSTELLVSTESTAALDGGQRVVYAYPGGFLKKNAGEALSGLRMEEHEAAQKQLKGESYCRALTAGHTFSVESHYRDDVNGKYVVRSVYHSATRERYTNTFTALASDVPFRAPRLTRKPTIPGTQTAIVVGKSGEEIWTDKYGRIKVQFHWDREGQKDENSSCWIRVAQGWAGKGWGQFFLPRIGQEVVVSFEEGDPDRPLVTGSVYNSEQVVPYTLPADQTKSTIQTESSKGGGGYNELRFEDKKDEEEVYFQAEKDFNRVVKNNDTLKVGFEKQDAGDQTVDVYNNRTVTLDQGSDKLQIKTGDRTLLVDAGNETVEVGTDRSLTVHGNETHQVDGDRTVTIDGNYTLKVKGNLTIDVDGTVTLKSGQAMSLESGDALSAEASTSLSTKAGTALTDEAGTALTAKAGTSLTASAGTTLSVSGSASGTVDGGGALTLKGGVVKIN